MRILALGGPGGSVLFVAMVLLCASLRPDYNHATQVMSVLGETGGPHAFLMNAAGFVPAGALFIAFGVSLASLVPRMPLSTLGSLLVCGFGAGIVAAGIFSCDPGCPRDAISIEATLHIVVSIVAFVSGVCACGVWALVFRKLEAWQSLWPYSAASAVVAVVLLLIFNESARSGEFKGVWQRLFLGTLYLWHAVIGVHAFRFAHAKTPAA